MTLLMSMAFCAVVLWASQAMSRTSIFLVLLASCAAPPMDTATAVTRANTVHSLAGWRLQWVDGDDLTLAGYPGLVGYTDWDRRTISVISSKPAILIHEAFHVAHSGQANHCNWSQFYIPDHERLEAWGAWDDDCDHVHCWSDDSGAHWSCSSL